MGKDFILALEMKFRWVPKILIIIILKKKGVSLREGEKAIIYMGQVWYNLTDIFKIPNSITSSGAAYNHLLQSCSRFYEYMIKGINIWWMNIWWYYEYLILLIKSIRPRFEERMYKYAFSKKCLIQ